RDATRTWVVEAIEEARRNLDFDLWAYVLMPEHVHLLIHPRRAEYSVGRILAALKRPVSVRAREHLIAAGNRAWVERLTVREGRKVVFRFWQPGGGYDQNLWKERPIREVIDYIHANPVRRGLVETPTDWFWSSARFWEGDLSGPLRMDPLA